MKNTFSNLARSVMLGGLDRQKQFFLDSRIAELVIEVFSVPEKPIDYSPEFIEPEQNVAVLVTGGLDSTVLYFRAVRQYGSRVKAFYVDFGQPYAEKEMRALRNLGISHASLEDDLPGVGSYWKHIIPARNFFLLSLIAEQITGGTILFGAVNGEMPEYGGDKSKEFLRKLNELFSQLPYPVKVETPLGDETKTDLIAWWRENLPIELLDETTTCFDSKAKHCGRCQACLRKYLAYLNNGLKLETETDVLVGCAEYIDKYRTLMTKKMLFGDTTIHYSERRCEQDLRALDILQGRI